MKRVRKTEYVLDDDEKSFLSLGPDFALFEQISVKKIENDILAATTKIRWSRMGKPMEEVTYDRPQDEVDLEEKTINGEKDGFYSKKYCTLTDAKEKLYFMLIEILVKGAGNVIDHNILVINHEKGEI